MSSKPYDAFDNPEQIIADLRRQLYERTIERDEARRKLEQRTAEHQPVAREQQTAMAEVLQVINSSHGDPTPVFAAILENAHRLCGATQGLLGVYEGGHFRAVATHGLAACIDALVRQPFRPPPGSPHQQLVEGAPTIHIADLVVETQWERDDPERLATLEMGIRTLLFVPLRKDGQLLGYISGDRLEVRPFADNEITLFQNFAAQAVIAMENARLIAETREALEQQTATAEVLQIINSSPGNLAPVFEAMLQKAVQLCEASFGIVWRFEDGLIDLGATYNVPAAFLEFHREPMRATPDSGPGRLMRGEPGFAVDNALEFPAYVAGDKLVRAIVDLAGARSVVTAPLRKDGAALGMITIYRQEVRPFTDKQIALLQNFAAQAVIAIENARLITETCEALEQQTATADVLRVINSSPGDLVPVFETMVERAMHLCEAAQGTLRLFDGEVFHLAAVSGRSSSVPSIRQFGVIRPLPSHPIEALVRGEPLVHLADARDTNGYRKVSAIRERVDAGGFRSWVAVALRKDKALLGAIILHRTEVRPFTDKQIALLQNFAGQAVIAMENARLIAETREALEQQTATAEVLQVINSSPGDLAPVFRAMLENAMRLCDAAFGFLLTNEAGRFRFAAGHGIPPQLAENLRRINFNPQPPDTHSRILAGAPFVQEADLKDDEVYRSGVSRGRRSIVDIGGARTALVVPLRQAGLVLGTITIYRQEVRPFTDKQITLLQNFAGQAVIAMENARLIAETREALDQQTATAEVLGIINSSPDDLAPVFDAMLEKAIHLCGADFGIFFTYDGEVLHAPAMRGVTSAYAEFLANHPLRPSPDNMHSRMIAGEPFVQIADVMTVPGYLSGDPMVRAFVDLGRGRTVLAVALRKDDLFFGEIAVYRREEGPFSDKQIAILQNFAAQAVIAMENARLLNEIRRRQDELRVTFDNMGDGVVMFDAELRTAAWNQNFREILDLPDSFVAERPSYAEYVRFLARRGEFGTIDVEAELQHLSANVGRQWSTERTRPDGRVIEVRHNPVPDGGFVLIYRDITERKRAEEQIRAARDALARQTQLDRRYLEWLRRLATFLRHEVRQPVAQINSSIELAQLKSQDAGRVAAHLSNAALGAQYVWNLIERASRATDAEAFVRQSNAALVDLSALLSDHIDTARETYSDLDFNLCRGEERVFAFIDPMLFKEAIGNILNNAASFALDGSSIEVELIKASPFVIVQVVNKGPLVPDNPEELYRCAEFGADREPIRPGDLGTPSRCLDTDSVGTKIAALLVCPAIVNDPSKIRHSASASHVRSRWGGGGFYSALIESY